MAMMRFIYNNAGIITIDLEKHELRFEGFKLDDPRIPEQFILENTITNTNQNQNQNQNVVTTVSTKRMLMQPLFGDLANSLVDKFYLLGSCSYLDTMESEKKHLKDLGHSDTVTREDIFYKHKKVDYSYNTFIMSMMEEEKHFFKRTVTSFLLDTWESQLEGYTAEQQISFESSGDRLEVQTQLGIIFEMPEERQYRNSLFNIIDNRVSAYTKSLNHSILEPGAGILAVEPIEYYLLSKERSPILNRKGPMSNQDKKFILKTLMQAKLDVEKNNYLLQSRLVAELTKCIDEFVSQDQEVKQLRQDITSEFALSQGHKPREKTETEKFDDIIHTHLSTYLNSGKRFFLFSRDPERLEVTRYINRELFPLLHNPDKKILTEDDKIGILKMLIEKQLEVEDYHKKYSKLGNIVSSRLATELHNSVEDLKKAGLVTADQVEKVTKEVELQALNKCKKK